jgi:hypothetical protein
MVTREFVHEYYGGARAGFFDIKGNADEGVNITNDSLLDQGQRLRRLTDAALVFTLLDQIEGLT